MKVIISGSCASKKYNNFVWHSNYPGGKFSRIFLAIFSGFSFRRCIKKVIIILFGTRNIREAENVFKIFNFILWIFPDFSTGFLLPDLVLIFLRDIFCENVVDFPGFFPRISVSGFIVLLDPCLCSSNGGHNVTPDHSSIYIQSGSKKDKKIIILL